MPFPLTAITQVLKQQKGVLHDQYHVKDIGVFGSYVRGEQRADSDLDILVEFDKPVGLFAFMDVQEYLQHILCVPKVDLVMKQTLKPYIGQRILKEVVYI